MSDYKVFGCDTDSIIFCRRDGSEITTEQQKLILEQVNSLFPARIRFEDDGYFPTAIVFKAKNYVLYDGKKIKTKGSALKDAKKETALKEFQSALIASIVDGREDYQEIYNKYVSEIVNLTDISRWSSKKTLTENAMTKDGTTQKKIRAAIQDTDYRSGDRCYLFFKADDSLCLAEKFDGDYNAKRLLGKLHKSTALFKEILPTETLFPKYHLKKAQAVLVTFKKT